MNRYWVAVAMLGLAGSSQALTLQWVTKWSPSQPLGVAFKKIVDTGSGYVIAGNLSSQMVSVIQTDYSGNLIRTGLYEPFASYQTWIRDLQVDSSGRIYLLAVGHPDAAYNHAQVACLDPVTMTTRWQKSFVPANTTFGAYFRGITMAVRPTVGGERVLLAYTADDTGTPGDRVDYVCWDASGNQIFAGSQDDGSSNTPTCSLAFPSIGGGFAIGGSVDEKSMVYRLSDTGTLLWKSINSNLGTHVNALGRNGSDLVGAGFFYGNSGYRVAGFKFASDGSVSSTYDANGSTPVVDMAQESGDNFIILSKTATGYELHRYNRSTGNLSKLGEYAFLNPTFVQVTSGGKAFVNGGGRLQHIQLINGSIVADVGRPDTLIHEATSTGSDSVFTVGEMLTSDQGFLSGFDTSYRGPTQMYANGYASRYPKSSFVDPSGAVVVLSESYDYLLRTTTTVTKFSPTGSVLWLRQLAYQLDPTMSGTRVMWSPSDSTVIAVGHRDGAAIVARLNSTTGVIGTIRKTTLAGHSLIPMDAKLGTDGNLWMAARASNALNQGREVLMRLNSAGQVLSNSIALPQSSLAETFALYQLSPTRWAVVKGTQYGPGGARVSYFDGSGVPTADFDFEMSENPRGVRSAQAPNGDLVVGVLRTSNSELRKFSATTGASIMNASLGQKQSGYEFAVGVSANGNAYMCARRESDGLAELQAVTSAGTVAWSGVFPSTVDKIMDIETDANNWVYVLADEYAYGGGPGTTQSTYLVRYLANGVRSAQRRLAGYSHSMTFTPGQGLHVIGSAPIKNRRTNLSVARYTSP